MLTIGNYVKAKTPEEAYELNQARSSRIMGGMMWMRLSNARVKTLIDISGLGLDQIEETEDEIRIGAMCTLRQIEQSEAVKKLCGDGIEEAHCRSSISESGDGWRKHLRKIRFFRRINCIFGTGYICRTL